MFFYLVGVASKSHRGTDPLTYHSAVKLPVGAVVRVPFRSTSCVGIVLGATVKPAFPTKAIGEQLVDQPLPATSLLLLKWLVSYYPAALGTIGQLFVPNALLQPAKSASPPTKAAAIKASPPPLTTQQATVVKQITHGPSSTYLLHGVTGSGKTRVYLELAGLSLDQGKSVLILTPEIGLTPQLMQTFQAVFGGQVLSGHSNLTPVQRRNLWLKVLGSTQPQILIGPRSMLFYPLKNLGLIVVDESHENAYKQGQAPYYHGVRVASQLAALHHAKLVMGSATPPLEDYYIASVKQIPILKLTQLATTDQTVEPSATIIDLRDKSTHSSQPFLSAPLVQALEATLRRHEQALLFLNRRGTARLILCQDCGWQALCPRCDIPLTYHGDSHMVRCHTCGFQQAAPNACPLCHSPEIIFRSIGTKALAEELKRLFPKARIQRFDTDNKKSERFEAHYAAVRAGEVDILVGTQVLTKGLDLPKLSLVGVVAADSSLHFPDFSAEERTYQLLSQVLGRINRGHLAGTAIIQTYTPDNPTIKAAVKRDWGTFYQQQISERQSFGWPPFRYLLHLTIRKASRQTANNAAAKLKTTLEKLNLPLEIIGPSPAFHERVDGKHQWQLVVKAKRRAHLLDVIAHVPTDWTYNIDPTDLL